MGTSERVLSTFWYDGYAVNGYGIYYLRGETLYVQVHETGERIKLYTAPQDCTRLFFSLLGDRAHRRPAPLQQLYHSSGQSPNRHRAQCTVLEL